MSTMSATLSVLVSLRGAEDANTSLHRSHISAGSGSEVLFNICIIRHLVQCDRSSRVGDKDMVAVSLRLDPLDTRIWQSLTWNKSAQRVSLIQSGHAGREV